MQVHHLHPGLAWLQYKDGWYLVAAPDQLHDMDLGMSIYVIDRFETEVDTAQVWRVEPGDAAYEEEIEGVDYDFRVRRVLVDVENSSLRASCDLLMDRDDSTGARDAVERVVRRLLDGLVGQPYWTGLELGYELAVQPTDLAEAHLSPYAQKWFERFLLKDPSAKRTL